MAGGVIQGAKSITPEAIRGHMKIPKDLQAAYEQIVAAGKKVMYSEQMKPQVQQMLRDEGAPLEQRLGKSIAGLMGILVSKSNKTLPPQLVIPAGCELVAEAGEFLQDAGVQITPGQIGEAINVFVMTVLEKEGITEDKIAAARGA